MRHSAAALIWVLLSSWMPAAQPPAYRDEGFRRVSLSPGQAAPVSFTLGPDDLRMLDRDMKWMVEPGTFRIMIGASSKDIRLRGEIAVR